ncbi:hypothetical protein EEJ42_33620 [Streptomyces botrytidirepellens]|uniref:Uncharacterized protein n=1 Tax=Streptomyces botrytidirepellens TaxID=2486417 RepID=A0A3M8UT25_9ACTN|nr:hypothetical protein EEJ42_33620 [Streptomyces botrytidirepellens]
MLCPGRPGSYRPFHASRVPVLPRSPGTAPRRPRVRRGGPGRARDRGVRRTGRPRDPDRRGRGGRGARGGAGRARRRARLVPRLDAVRRAVRRTVHRPRRPRPRPAHLARAVPHRP